MPRLAHRTAYGRSGRGHGSRVFVHSQLPRPGHPAAMGVERAALSRGGLRVRVWCVCVCVCVCARVCVCHSQIAISGLTSLAQMADKRRETKRDCRLLGPRQSSKAEQ